MSLSYEASNDELLLLDRMNGVSFDNEHDYQMSQLKSLKDRGLSYKKRRMEMRSEFETFLAQSLGQEASKNMSRLMYDPIYEFPRGYDFSGNLNWQMFLESKQYRPDLLDIDEFEVAARWSSLSSSMEVTSSESPQVLEPSSSLSLVEPRNDESPQALINTQVVGSAALEENWSGRIDFAISERSSSQSFDEFGHSGRYYETRRALDAALQDGLEALIKRDQDVATICANLFRDKDGNIVVESHPKFNNSANGTGMIGNFPPISQGKEGVMTKNGEATTLTFDQLRAACQKIDPNWTLLDLGYTDDYLPIIVPYENAKGQPFSAKRDIFAKFTVEEWIAVISTRCHHYCQHFIDLFEQGCNVFKYVFYGDGKYLQPLFLEAFRRAKEFVRANCHELATSVEAVELQVKNAPHWCKVIHPLTQEVRFGMDDGIAFLQDVDVSRSTHFREGDFTHLQFDKGIGQDMLSCLLAILKGNSATALLATILKSDVDEENPKYSRFGIRDRKIQSCLRSYLRTHDKKIFVFVTTQPDDAPTPSTVDELTVHDLARYLNYLRWKDMTAEERREAMMPAHRALSNLREGMTAEERREAMQHLHSVEVQAKKQNTDDAKWTAKFDKLAAFQAVNGNLNVPKGHELYAWTYNQRTAKNNPKSTNKINNEKIGLLDGLGFEW